MPEVWLQTSGQERSGLHMRYAELKEPFATISSHLGSSSKSANVFWWILENSLVCAGKMLKLCQRPGPLHLLPLAISLWGSAIWYSFSNTMCQFPLLVKCLGLPYQDRYFPFTIPRGVLESGWSQIRVFASLWEWKRLNSPTLGWFLGLTINYLLHYSCEGYTIPHFLSVRSQPIYFRDVPSYLAASSSSGCNCSFR